MLIRLTYIAREVQFVLNSTAFLIKVGQYCHLTLPA